MFRLKPFALLLVLLLQTAPPLISEIHMYSSGQGWAIGGSPEQLQSMLHTEDGAETWTDVTPPDVSLTPFIQVHAAFLDESHAWAVYSDRPVLWMTADAGSTWTAVDLPDLYAPVSSIQLLNRQQGWLLLLDCCAASHEGAYLYGTMDAARSWHLLNEDGYWQPSHDDVPHDLGSIYHSGITFFDDNVGWLTLASFATDVGAVLQTLDGGHSWQRLTLQAPEWTRLQDRSAASANPPCGFFQPMALSPASVTIIAQCLLDNPDPQPAPRFGVYLYHSGDAGQTWTINAVPNTIVSPQNTYSAPGFVLQMIDARQGWLLSQGQLYRTGDGGQTWTRIAAPGDASQLDFIDEKTGWLVTGDHRLMHTQDGGTSWIALPL
jgi:photosystem II stability/assembly factor-like uncharacterized protein